MSSNTSSLDYSIKLNDGNVIPSLALGTATPPEEHEAVPEAVKAAIRAGIRHIDTAWYYGTEKYIGKALKELIDAGEIKREELFITTKVWPALWDRAETSIKKSLEDTGLEYFDLVLQHWPQTFKGTDKNGLPSRPYDENGILHFGAGDYLETYKQIIDLRKRTNWIKSVGVSNFHIHHLKRAIEETGVVPAVDQIEHHYRLADQIGLIEYAKSQNIAIEAYAVFGSSIAGLIDEPIVKKFADKYGTTVNSVLISYHVLNNRIALARSKTPERIEDFTVLTPLTKDDIEELDKAGIENPKRYITDDWGVGLGFKHWKTKYSWEESK
ncbi:hypothetical protein WICMUC_005479 [Wickerhamomyces mucosus]|uniref:NADP-dependent oxidoreductase domain-containing protein n=1 Tax=Wickerhamomyces mucosus TaxID=1378264 RepID=A0A9P8P7B2_9ASCO|nr:hypothetical protein WICMUC_005479 [Wickerhamomyces mucosus]